MFGRGRRSVREDCAADEEWGGLGFGEDVLVDGQHGEEGNRGDQWDFTGGVGGADGVAEEGGGLGVGCFVHALLLCMVLLGFFFVSVCVVQVGFGA